MCWKSSFWSSCSILLAQESPIRMTCLMFGLVATASAHLVKSEFFSEPPARRIIGELNDFIAAMPVSGVVAKESFMNLMPFFSATSSRRWGSPLNSRITFWISGRDTPIKVAASDAGRTFSILWGPRSEISSA